MKIQRVKGTRDFYPEEQYAQDYMFRIWKKAAKAFGYQNFDGPMLEPVELLKAKSGDEISNQIYSFTDKGGREVAIRPELTPTLARMLAARKDLKKPLRLYNIGRFWRYEQPQSGRLREFWQLNMDFLGETSMLADAEIIATLVSIAQAFGLTPEDCYVRLGNRKLIEGLLISTGVPKQKMKEVFRLVDKLDKIGEKNFSLSLNDISVSNATTKKLLSLFSIRDVGKIPSGVLDKEGQEGLKELQELVKYLESFGVMPFVELDLSVVRGLDYYTSTVFELYDRSKEFRAIAGGGRYENLVAAFGGENLPGVGYGMGDAVLGLFLAKKKKIPAFKRDVDVYVIPLTEDVLEETLTLCNALRNASLNVEMGLPTRKLSKQLGDLDKSGIPYCIIVGPEEVKKKQVRIRSLIKQQEEVVERSLFLKQPTAHFV